MLEAQTCLSCIVNNSTFKSNHSRPFCIYYLNSVAFPLFSSPRNAIFSVSITDASKFYENGAKLFPFNEIRLIRSALIICPVINKLLLLQRVLSIINPRAHIHTVIIFFHAGRMVENLPMIHQNPPRTFHCTAEPSRTIPIVSRCSFSQSSQWAAVRLLL